jgi:hypothetical protein
MMLCEDNEGSDKILVIRKQKIRLFDFQREAEDHIYKLRKLFEKLPVADLEGNRKRLLDRLSDLNKLVFYKLRQEDLLECQVESIEER